MVSPKLCKVKDWCGLRCIMLCYELLHADDHDNDDDDDDVTPMIGFMSSKCVRLMMI